MPDQPSYQVPTSDYIGIELPAVDYTDAPPVDTDEPPSPQDQPSNVDDAGVAHFLVLKPGEDEACGGCGQPWPCPDAQHLMVLPVVE